MNKWLLRGLVFAALMVIVRLLQGGLINVWETRAGLISIVLVAAFAVAVFVWGLVDGRADAGANPDPDRRGDLAMTWLLAGLFAGVVSGAVAWFIGLFYDNIYVGGFIGEVTTFAAFTALLTFLVATVGVAIGRFLVDRKAAQASSADDRADTDVFAAVRADGYDVAPAGTEAAPRTSPVALAERDEKQSPAADDEADTTVERRDTT